MKKCLFLALLGMSISACSNDETVAETASAKTDKSASVSRTKPEASSIMVRYGQNKAKLSYDEATGIFASDCREYLEAHGQTTANLSNDQIINLFITNY
jgi:hypothetical protein